MTFYKGAVIAVLAWILPMASSQSAETVRIHETFNDFVFAGCITSLLEGAPLQTYAKRTYLQPATPQLTAAFLQGKLGQAYIKPDPEVSVVIAQFPDGACIVAARTSPDLKALVSNFESVLLGSGMPFKAGKRKASADNAATTTRTYQGKIDSTVVYVTLATTPDGTGVLAQAIATVSTK